MAGVPRHCTAPQVQVRLGQRGTNLQVVARRTFMVDGRQLLPGVEQLLTRGHGPPHAARSGEVIGRRGVEDAAGTGRIDAAFDLTHCLRDVEGSAVEVLDYAVRGGLHPFHQRVGAVQLVALLFVELAHRRADCHVRTVQLVSNLLLLCLDGAHLFQAPLIGLIEVHRIADEELGEALVALTAHRILRRGLRLQLVGEPVSELAESFFGFHDLGGIGVEAEVLEHGAGVGKPLALHEHFRNLALRGHHASRRRLDQGLLVAA